MGPPQAIGPHASPKSIVIRAVWSCRIALHDRPFERRFTVADDGATPRLIARRVRSSLVEPAGTPTRQRGQRSQDVHERPVVERAASPSRGSPIVEPWLGGSRWWRLCVALIAVSAPMMYDAGLPRWTAFRSLERGSPRATDEGGRTLGIGTKGEPLDAAQGAPGVAVFGWRVGPVAGKVCRA